MYVSVDKEGLIKVKFWKSPAFGYLRDWAFFYNFGSYYWKTDRIFVKILSQRYQYPWTRKTPLHFGSRPDPESGCGLWILITFALAEVCTL